MPTVTSWTDALRDTRSLIRFRMATIRKRRRLRWSIATLGVLTLATASVPAFLPGAADYDRSHGYAFDIFLILPSVYAGFLMLAAISAVASGGGRELVPRDQGVAFPISPAVDHLGALLMAPLNIAWLLQGWLLLGATAYVVGPGAVVFAEVVAVLWLFLATALAQVVAWTMEAIRRGPHGIAIARTVIGAVAGSAGLVFATGHLNAVLDGLPTVYLVAGSPPWPMASASSGRSPCWSSRPRPPAPYSSESCRRVPRSPEPPATRPGSRPVPTRPDGTRRPTSARWSASTGQRSGVRCPCVAGSCSWPSHQG